MIQCGPYGPNHATAGTFAFRTELLKQTQYEDHAALAEEKAFLKNYTVPFVQLDPLKTILVFSHEHNTFDKKKMLENPHPDFLKPSDKTIESFIRLKKEDKIKQFFTTDIDALLLAYEPGLPAMKPDVLIQIKKIEEERTRLLNQIMIQRPGEQPTALNQQEILALINQQQAHIQTLTNKNAELENTIQQMQLLLIKPDTRVKLKSMPDLH